jgi:hypothetical protein
MRHNLHGKPAQIRSASSAPHQHILWVLQGRGPIAGSRPYSNRTKRGRQGGSITLCLVGYPPLTQLSNARAMRASLLKNARSVAACSCWYFSRPASPLRGARGPSDNNIRCGQARTGLKASDLGQRLVCPCSSRSLSQLVSSWPCRRQRHRLELLKHKQPGHRTHSARAHLRGLPQVEPTARQWTGC